MRLKEDDDISGLKMKFAENGSITIQLKNDTHPFHYSSPESFLNDLSNYFLKKIDNSQEEIKWEIYSYAITIFERIDYEYHVDFGRLEVKSELGRHISYFRKLQQANDSVKANSIKSTKLNWTDNKNVLYDLFYQMKHLYGNEGKPLIDNTNEEIAQFLKESFSCLENVAFDTIRGAISKDNPPKKSSRRIELIK